MDWFFQSSETVTEANRCDHMASICNDPTAVSSLNAKLCLANDETLKYFFGYYLFCSDVCLFLVF